MKKHWVFILLIVMPLIGCSPDFWFTPEQQGQRLMDADQFEQAAEVFVDPFRKGVAFFRAGDFEAASASFGRLNTPEAYFNRGNSLVMSGKYTEAVSAYDQALELKGGWLEAEENRKIARLRAEQLKFEGGNMTDGMLGADAIVFDEGGKSESNEDDTFSADSGMGASDELIKELWMRRVQTKPADFLKAKFSYQYSRKTNQ